MKNFIFVLLVAFLIVQAFAVEQEDPEHEFLGIGKSYRYRRGYSSPWGRWGKGTWGKSSWGNPVYGGSGNWGRASGYGGGYGTVGGFGGYSGIYHNADDSQDSQEQ